MVDDAQIDRRRLSRLLQATSRVQAATTEHEVLELVASAVRDSGWEAVGVHLYRDWATVDAVFVGLSESEVAALRAAHPDPTERAARYGPLRDRFRVSRSYFIPAEERESLGLEDPPRKSRPSRAEEEGWDPCDVAYVPMYGQDGEVVGAISLDDPVDGRLPDEQTFRYLEFFAELAAATITTLRLAAERERAVEALQNSEQRMRALSDASFDAIFLSEQGICVDQSRTAERIFGYTTEEAIGRPGTDWIAPVDREMVKSHMISGREEPYEALALRKDGSTLTVRIQARLIDYQGRPVRVTSLTDITDEEARREELRKSEEMLALALDATSDGAWELRLPADTWSRSDSWYELTGYSREELEAWEDQHGSIIHPDDAPAMFDAMSGHQHGLIPEYRVEFRIRHRSGEWRWLLGRGRIMVRDEAGNALRLIGTDTDITDRKRAEEGLLQLQKMEAVGTLAAGMAHDFNNLLTAIIGHAELARIAMEERGVSTEEIEGVVTAAMRGAGISKALLTFCRRTPVRMMVLDLGRYVADSTAMLRRVLPAIIEMKIEGAERGRWWIEGDAVQINQVLMNLVVNARDAMPEGGTLRIRISGTATRAPDDPGTIVLSVEDTGQGIAPDDLPRVIDPFFTTKPRGQGTGLGLSVVHGIVESHGARMELQSELGSGTSVSVVFPARTNPEEQTVSVEEGTPRPKVECLVLLADDNEQVRHVLAAGLRAAGCRVLEAVDGREALTIFEESGEVIDLVVLDLDMPQVTGTACLEKMRAVRSDLPAILISGLSQSGPESHSPDLFRFMRKPFTTLDLAQAVGEMLASRRDR
jgi:two-component system, cell cycle sensor histidine kinase and response regulator CckA